MTHFIDLTTSPVLGRLRGINRKHRLRSRHHAAIEDWPDTAELDVLDPGALETRDHLPCTDAMFVVSDRLKAVLSSVAPQAELRPAMAGGKRVWISVPFGGGDVMYESTGQPTYSGSGYRVTHAVNLRVDETPKQPWCQVRNTALVALGAEVVAAATAAGIAWTPLETIADYRPLRPHPYMIAGARGGHVETLEALEAWPAAPERVAHPLHDWVRDEDFDKPDPDAAWSRLVHSEEVDDAAFARSCSGLPLPRLRASLDPDCAKSKLKKRWKDATTATSLGCKGLFAASAALADTLGSSCRYTPIELRCDKLGETHAGFSLVEPPAVDWIDWSRSDVMYLWSGMYDGYAGLHPIEDSYTATQPIVRVAGTNLILLHEMLAAKLAKELVLRPLHELSGGLNLDDFLRVR